MPFAPRPTFEWRLRSRNLSLGVRTHVMGILNVTPDSFYDGGRYADVASAVAHARQMAADGADIVDVGGESTRPGSQPVPATVLLCRAGDLVIELDWHGLEPDLTWAERLVGAIVAAARN